MQFATLSNGVKMPMLGFGVFQIAPGEACQKAVSDAISVGYRMFDTASSYQNEEWVGDAIKNSRLPREEFFLTTKAYIHQMGFEKTLAAFDESLEKLRTDYIDLYLVHMPFGDYYGAWRALEKLYCEGKVRAIGVSNFSSARLLDLCMNCDVKPMVNQIEHHPHFQREEEISAMKELGVQVEAWAPFAEGMKGMFGEPTLSKIAEKHGRSVAQVILRWNVQCGIPAIAKSVHKNRMEENFNVWDFELDDDDIRQIHSLDKNRPSMLDVENVNEVRRVHDYMKNPVVTSLR